MMKFIKKTLVILVATAVLFSTQITNNTALSDSFVVVANAASSSKLKSPTKITSSSTVDTVTLQWRKVSGANAYRVYLFNKENGKYEKYMDVSNTKCTIKIYKVKQNINLRLPRL